MIIFVFSGHETAFKNGLSHKVLFVKLNHEYEKLNPESAAFEESIFSLDKLTALGNQEKLTPSITLKEPSESASEVEFKKFPQVVTNPVEDYYYKSSELASQPYPLTPSTPEYPVRAVANNTEGWVRLMLKIEENGAVSGVEVLESYPVGVFDDAAVANFKFTNFSPGIRDGHPVKSRIILKINFSLDDLKGRQKNESSEH